MDQETQVPVTGDAAQPEPRPRLSRRKLLVYGAAGVAGVACGGGGLGWYFTSRARAATVAEVFKNDAPSGRVWEDWQQRGWAREASHYLKLGKNLQCKLCHNECLLAPGDRGRCRNRVHKDGTLYTLAYGNPVVAKSDPIEKKPLFHFLPGSSAFSFAATGCGFRCLNCQNWDISQRKPEELKDPRGDAVKIAPRNIDTASEVQLNRVTILPEEMVAIAEHHHCRSIAYTYSEPVVWYEYMFDTAKAARAKGIKNVLVTCGYIQQEPLKELCEYLDGVHVDLKGFTEESYQKLNSGKLAPILATLKTLQREKVWFEVINLIVPTYTDDPEMIRPMCRWLVDNLGPDCVLHFSRFHPQHKLTQLPPTPTETLTAARSIAREEGLHYVYIGNCVELPDAENTICPSPKCGKTIVERTVFSTLSVDIVDGKCKHCQQAIAGVWT